MNNKYELSSVQKNIWMLENFYKGTPINNLVGYVIFDEKIDYSVMIEALNLYVKFNDILRAKVVTEGDNVFQEIKEYKEISPKVYDFVNKTKDEVDSFIEDYAKIPLDINERMFDFNIIYIKNQKTIVLVKFHHLVADAWSFISLFMSEMIEYYYKVKENVIIEIEEKPKYNILLDREKEYKDSNKYIQDKEFWNEEMKDLENYSVMKNANIKYSNKAKRKIKKIYKKDYEKISKFCKDNRVSEYSLFLTALSIYMYRIQNTDNDITIGTPILNRVTREEKETAGLFISTVPLRFKIEQDETFLDTCKKINSKLFTIFRHQKYPFSKIAENVYSENKDIKKLYDVMISYQNTKYSDIAKEKNVVRVWQFQGFQQEQFILHITNHDGKDELELFYDYLVDLFTDEEIDYIHERLLNLVLTGIKEETKVSKLPVITKSERKLILDVFNDTYADYPKYENIISIFESRVIEHPDKIAVKYNDESITYRKLLEKVDILADYLIKKGVEKDEVVGIKVDRGINQIISMLATLKAGGCYMPIHSEWPEERVLFMIEDSKPKAIITQEKYMDMFTVVNECNFNILDSDIVIDVDKYLEEHKEHVEVKYNIDPQDLAYIIYTSGTTGRPKGTLISHRNVVRLLLTENYPYEFSENDIWTMFHTYTFDFSVWEMYGALLLGGTLIIVPEDTAKDTRKYLELLKKEKVTVQNQTPSYLYKVIETEMMEKDARLCVRYIILGGEAFHPRNCLEFQKKYPNTKIVNGYGITETTVFTSQKVITEKEMETNESNIGKQLPTRKVFILDRNLELMPIGVEGELCESGLGVCRGYLNNKEMTDKKFVKNPYGRGMLYKSGDVAKYKFDGDIIYVGRNDNQVKIRGFRIEIEEVEKLILKIPGIKKATLFPYGKGEENRALYCFVVPEDGVRITNTEIKERLLENIPLYMLPLIYIVKDFPVNTNGKVNKEKLMSYIDETMEIKKKNAVTAKTALEKKVLKVFKKESGGVINGITDNIFENNVDSLQILKIALELSKENINISAQDIYDAMDVKTLCKNIEENITKGDEEIAKLKEDRKKYIEFYSKKFNLKNVFLTGASGFLGVHILNSLLKEKEVKKVYCLIRRKNNVSGKERLDRTYKNYFPEDNLLNYNKKVEVVEGDFLKPSLGLSKEKYEEIAKEATTIINAAADVKHFGKYEDFYNSNVRSVANLIKLVKKNNIDFAHISTESVCGYNKIENIKEYDESSFDIGQTFFDNVYITTKFEAEKLIEEYANAAPFRNVKIFRLGNIMPRIKDGKFQLNHKDNAFIQKIKGIIKIKNVPDMLLQSITDISPVDVCADSVVRLLRDDDTMCVYHISNKNIKVADIVDILNTMEYKIETCDLDSFKEKVLNIKEDYIVILQEQFNKLGYDLNIIKNERTIDTLEDLNIVWPEIDKNYMKYIIDIINKK